MAYVDFKALKSAVRMMDVLAWLKIELAPEGQTLRGECPLCNRGGDRALVCTPSKHLWYCHSEECGGDTIAFVARVHGSSTKEAAAAMAKHFAFGKGDSERSTSSPSTVTVPERTSEKGPKLGQDGLSKVKARLTYDHPLIALLGLSKAVCEAIGIGYLPKGTKGQRVLIPLRLEDGTLVDYMGIATEPEQVPLLLFSDNLDEKISATPPAKEEEKPKQTADALRAMFRVVEGRKTA